MRHELADENAIRRTGRTPSSAPVLSSSVLVSCFVVTSSIFLRRCPGRKFLNLSRSFLEQIETRFGLQFSISHFVSVGRLFSVASSISLDYRSERKFLCLMETPFFGEDQETLVVLHLLILNSLL